MTKDCQQFKISKQGLLDTSASELESFFRELLPDEQFRFITFQSNDYRAEQLTCLLYNYIPETVYVTVENAADIEPAVEKLMDLNPGVEWSGVKLKYFEKNSSGLSCITIELYLVKIPMRVNAAGKLVTL